MRKLLSVFLSTVCAVGMCLNFSACNKEDEEKYQVSKEEYEAAFSIETLRNVTISMTGPYWERDHIKSYFYSEGENFALCSYSEDTQYYGRYYGIENGKEFCYLYGSERLADFTEEQASWMKYDNPSAYSDKGVNFVLHYRRDFHLLEYNAKTKSYNFEFTAYGETGVYSYYFNDKKLTKFVITNEADNYEYICEFYDYGTTTIPIKVDGNINENGNDSNDSNDIFYTASYPQDFEYNGRHYRLVQGVGLKTTVTQEELGELLGYIIREEDVSAFTQEYLNVDYVIDNGIYDYETNNRVAFYSVKAYPDLSLICMNQLGEYVLFRDITDLLA